MTVLIHSLLDLWSFISSFFFFFGVISLHTCAGFTKKKAVESVFLTDELVSPYFTKRENVNLPVSSTATVANVFVRFETLISKKNEAAHKRKTRKPEA